METRWGKLLGRYEIVAELGRGAMGVVYKARDPKIDRFVAVKTISLLGQDPAEEKEYRERFFHEAQTAGRLLHPGIVTVFDVGEEPESNAPYIVMEYVTGQALSGLLSGEGGKLPLATALRLTEEIAQALDYAHAQGVVHRDIKPSNILVTTEGNAKITDFGIAKLHLAELTVPGRVVGSPAYMSPEQLNDQPVDGRSDLFSLGVILYSMITGYRPFQGSGVTTVCFKVANHAPLPPTALDPDLPRGVDAVLARAMAKDSAQRYQRGIELALDVRELLERCTSPGKAKGWWADTSLAHSAIHPSHSSVRGNSSPLGAGLASSSVHYVRSKISRSIRALGGPTGRASAKWILGLCLIVGLCSVALRWKALQGDSTAASTTASAKNDLSPAGQGREDRELEAAQKPARSLLAPAVAASTLDIRIDHPFAVGKVSVWVDKELAYSHSLTGATKRHFIVFRGAQGHESGRVTVPSGKHRLRVRVQSSSDAYDQQKNISESFPKGADKTLLINFAGQHKELHLALQ